MNHREPPHMAAGTRRALHCLALLLLPAFAPGGAQADTRPRQPNPGKATSGAGRTPYLPALGALPLRFQEAAPPPDLTTRPAAAAPPVPPLSVAESSVALANAAAARSAPAPTPPAPPPPAAPVVEVGPERVPLAPPETAPLPAKTPAAVLPDDARPPVRPEDFLPYFQIPGSAKNPADVTLLVPGAKSAPAPASVPPSSATYTQTR